MREKFNKNLIKKFNKNLTIACFYESKTNIK